MAEAVYEGMFLLDSGRYGRDPEGVAGQIPEMIRQAGGEMLVSRLWEERRLAFPIKGHRKGTYWLTYFRLDGPKLGDINRKCQLSDSILRALFVKIDSRIVDTLVEHAQSGGARRTTTPAGVVHRKEDGAPEKDKQQEQDKAAAGDAVEVESDDSDKPVSEGGQAAVP